MSEANMSKQEILLTIVIPIYNVEQYLNQCLDSLLNQTNQNFYVVMVDDGSTDKSGEIAKMYVTKNPEKYKYVYKKNAGLGAARNTGMKYVNTCYVEFLDSDDWLKPNVVESFYNQLHVISEDVDIFFMKPIIYDMATSKYLPWYDNELLEDIFREHMVIAPVIDHRMYDLEPNVNRSIWNYRFLKENQFQFPEGVKWEDVFPHFYLFHLAKRCALMKNTGFIYRINSGGQITASSGRGRMDTITVFAQTFSYAFAHQWTTSEIAHVVEMLIKFTLWNIKVTKNEVLGDFVRGIHGIYRAIPKSIFFEYQKIFLPGKKRKMFWRIMRSPFWIFFSDVYRYDKLKRILLKFCGMWRRKR